MHIPYQTHQCQKQEVQSEKVEYFCREALMSGDVKQKAERAIAGSVPPLALRLARVWHSLVTKSGGKPSVIGSLRSCWFPTPQPSACTLRLASAGTVWVTSAVVFLSHSLLFVTFAYRPVRCLRGVEQSIEAFCWICLNIHRKHPDFFFFVSADTRDIRFSFC